MSILDELRESTNTLERETAEMESTYISLSALCKDLEQRLSERFDEIEQLLSRLENEIRDGRVKRVVEEI